MDHWIGHGPVRRWRTGWLRVWCKCGIENYPCPTVIAHQRYQEGLREARDWRAAQRRRAGYEATVDNWWENPR